MSKTVMKSKISQISKMTQMSKIGDTNLNCESETGARQFKQAEQFG